MIRLGGCKSGADHSKIARDRRAAAAAARRLLAQPDWLILDTETTGLQRAAICQIAILDAAGEVCLDTLIRPTVPIPAETTRIHGITDAMVRDAPGFPEVYPRLRALLDRRRTVIYNAAFDVSILAYCCERHALPALDLTPWCAMQTYACWIGEQCEYYGDYRWQPLPGGDHTALGDCRAVLRLLQDMAAGADWRTGRQSRP